jgi:hypothetical protein
MKDRDTTRAAKIMLDFARLTGLEPAGAHPPKRYLWTDAFAVCNLLGLHRLTRDETFLHLALRLVDQVHHTLGRHRDDDTRRGWISGLGEAEGEEHPTAGGLRIGKSLPERRQDEPPDDRLEWDRDGQYFHYLTRWMHALKLAGWSAGDPRYLRWAMELAKLAHGRFTSGPPRRGRRGMFWKMSIDLSCPLVSSMGQHDPLDGFVTFCDLQTASGDFRGSSFPGLRAEIADLAGILGGMDISTADPLGTGGLLTDALRLAAIRVKGSPGSVGKIQPDLQLPGLLGSVLEASLFGLDAFADSGCLGLPAGDRLAFRELGLAIGLSVVEELLPLIHDNPGSFGGDRSLEVQAEALRLYVPLRDAITGFWMDRRNRAGGPWIEHREINMVMLASALAPEGYLGTGMGKEA